MDTMQDFTKGITDFLQANNDRAALIFSFSMLEQFIGDLIKIKCKHSRAYENFSAFHKISLLHELDLISEQEYESINWLREKRNDAAHQPGYSLDESTIPARWLMKDMGEMSALNNYLITTIGGFWNAHPEIRRHYQE
ncbi:MAG: hypothetical protein RPU63_01750 [Candidatus Sedimenticola sp. (ex Thyasira tokunagai)]